MDFLMVGGCRISKPTTQTNTKDKTNSKQNKTNHSIPDKEILIWCITILFTFRKQ